MSASTNLVCRASFNSVVSISRVRFFRISSRSVFSILDLNSLPYESQVLTARAQHEVLRVTQLLSALTFPICNRSSLYDSWALNGDMHGSRLCPKTIEVVISYSQRPWRTKTQRHCFLLGWPSFCNTTDWLVIFSKVRKSSSRIRIGEFHLVSESWFSYKGLTSK